MEEDEEIDENQEYFIPEEKKKSRIKIDETFNPKCRCPELTCPRHSNCKECKEYHSKRMQLTYCGK